MVTAAQQRARIFVVSVVGREIAAGKYMRRIKTTDAFINTRRNAHLVPGEYVLSQTPRLAHSRTLGA